MGNGQSVDLLLLVWNRKEYTEMTLRSLVQCTLFPFKLHIVDNCSEEPTKKFLEEWVESHPELVGSYRRESENLGLPIPTQRFWDEMVASGRSWWGKIDNDVEFSEGWLGRLVEVMEKCPSVVVASICHYPKDFEREAQRQGVGEEGGVEFFARTHVGGCGYLMRREAYDKAGRMCNAFGKMFGWSMYQHKLNKLGLLTAYAYPLIPARHLGAWEGQHITNDEYASYAERVKRFRLEASRVFWSKWKV